MPLPRRCVRALVPLFLPLLAAAAHAGPAAPSRAAAATSRADSIAAAPNAVSAIKALAKAQHLDEAESAARTYLARTSHAKGVDSLAVAAAIDCLLDVLDWKSAYGTSEFRDLAERSARLHDAYSPPDDLARGDAWQYLAFSRRAASDFRGALELYERTLHLQEHVLGADDLEVSKTLNRMVAVNRMLGDRVRARALLERALAIREHRLPADHPDLARLLGNLALFDMEDGEYTESRALYDRVLRIQEASKGPDDAQVGVTLLNLSTLSARLGEPERAAEQLRRSIRILEAKLGPSRHEVVIAKSNLGVTLQRLGRVEEAESLLRQALTTLDSTKQGGATLRAEVANALAGACAATGKLVESDSLYRDALAVQARTVGPGHWLLAETLLGLAATELDEGHADSAAAHATRALEIDEATFGPAHPFVARDLAVRARARLHSGDLAGGSDDALRAEHIGSAHLRATARALPERVALEYAAARAKGMDLALDALARSADDAARTRATWDAVVRSRAIVLDEMAERHRAVRDDADTTVAGLANESVRRHEWLARLFVRGVEDSAAAYRAEVEAAQRTCDSVDAALAARSAAFRAQRERAGAGLAEVSAALPPRAALVAFARMNPSEDGRSAHASPEGPPRYLAFVARAGAEPRTVPLGDAARIDSLVAAWRAAIGAQTVPRRRGARHFGSVLREAIWDPVEELVGDTRQVFLVPDGALQLVNFAALPVGSRAYLVEQGQRLHVLSTERDLLRPAQRFVAPGLLAMGGPDFDDAPAPAVALAGAAPAGRATFRGGSPDCASFASHRFLALPVSAREAEEVAALWTRTHAHGPAATTLTGSAASEGAFKQLAPTAGILHLATHGYFLDPACAAGDPATNVGLRGNPLLGSGLVLAGANRRASGAQGDDGVLTAEEIAAMDLSGASLVALSSCDSGLGSLVAGEGVFGLRRAFEIAGAGSVVMSLWKVGDVEARRWMRVFYESRLVRGSSIAESAHDATLRVLAAKRAAGEGDDPAAWAAFVVSGDWR